MHFLVGWPAALQLPPLPPLAAAQHHQQQTANGADGSLPLSVAAIADRSAASLTPVIALTWRSSQTRRCIYSTSNKSAAEKQRTKITAMGSASGGGG